MTPYTLINEAFLAKIKDDEWANESYYDFYLEDWEQIMESSIIYFKFPKCSLTRGNYEQPEGSGTYIKAFAADLGYEEIQIIATLMKKEWLDRVIYNWESIKMLYDERDFSPANLLNQLIKLQERTEKTCRSLQKLYSRSIPDGNGGKKSYPFGNFAGGK